jgi:hypothetical protein
MSRRPVTLRLGGMGTRTTLSLVPAAAMLAAGTALLFALGAQSATDPRAPAILERTGSAQSVKSECGVSGDLVGDANPAMVAAVLCRAER